MSSARDVSARWRAATPLAVLNRFLYSSSVKEISGTGTPPRGRLAHRRAALTALRVCVRAASEARSLVYKIFSASPNPSLKDYQLEAVDNNNRMQQILETNFHHADAVDAPVLAGFLEHQNRLKREMLSEDKAPIAKDLLEVVGRIKLIDPEFANMIEKRFRDKAQKIRRLSGMSPEP